MKKYTKKEIIKTLERILLETLFVDEVRDSDIIADIMTFPEDIKFIKGKIRDSFNFDIKRDISKMSVHDLYTFVYAYMKKHDRVQVNTPYSAVRTDVSPNTLFAPNKIWAKRTLFSAVMNHLRTSIGRNVQSTELIGDVLYEYSSDIMGSKSIPLCHAIQDLEKFFDIKIDSEMRIYNIVNAAERSLISQGKMIAESPIKDAGGDDEILWQVVIRTLPLKFFSNVLYHEFGVNIQDYKLRKIASFDELKQKILMAQSINNKTK